MSRDGVPPSGLPDPLDWIQWYDDVVEAILATIEAADVDWATDASGESWIVEGESRPRGIGYPHAMLMGLEKQRRESSDRTDELQQLQAEINVFIKGSTRDQSALKERARNTMAAVETALYANRSLGGVAKTSYVDSATPFEMLTEDTSEGVGSIQYVILKDAEHPY